MEFEQLVKLIQTVSESELTGLKYEENGVKLQLLKEKEQVVTSIVPAATAGADQTAVQTTGNAAAATQAEEHSAGEKPGKIIKSPLVGTFYASPSEEADPFVMVGASVKKGQTIAIVEAMKLMNDIESEFDGTVAEVMAGNGDAIEYGQPLFRIV